MFGTSWRVGRIAGIEVRVDSSWVVIALLITYSLYLRFSLVYPSLSTGGAVGIAILAAVLFFGSVLGHELAHALVSQARGIRVQDITLFLFGGATRARVESRGPGDEFIIAVVGPLTSALLAVLFGIIDVFGRDALGRPLAGAFGYLAWVNLLLAGFNLVPGFPLDGGRLLPGPGRPGLLRGAPAPAHAPRRPGAGRDGQRSAADPAGADPPGGRGPVFHALRPRRVPGRGAGAHDRSADHAGSAARPPRSVVHPSGAGLDGLARRPDRGPAGCPDGSGDG